MNAVMDLNVSDVLQEVTDAFERYEDALLNNKVHVLDELFWPSDFTVRYGIGENLVGIEAIRAFRNAPPSASLARTRANTVITTFGRDFATAMTEFHRAERIGRQSQTWVRFAEGWRVVAAHVSFLAE